MDADELRATVERLAAENPVFCRHLARVRVPAGHAALTLEEVSRQLGFSRQPDRLVLWHGFRGMEAMGLGVAVVGRKGKPSRFEPTADLDARRLVEAVRAAAAPPGGVERLEFQAVPTTTPPDPGKQVTYPFPIRPGVTATLTLPADLTRGEVDRLKLFLDSLVSG